MEEVCISGVPGLIVTILGGLVTIVTSSVFANFVKPDTALGKVVNWVALNIKTPKKQ